MISKLVESGYLSTYNEGSEFTSLPPAEVVEVCGCDDGSPSVKGSVICVMVDSQLHTQETGSRRWSLMESCILFVRGAHCATRDWEAPRGKATIALG